MGLAYEIKHLKVKSKMRESIITLIVIQNVFRKRNLIGGWLQDDSQLKHENLVTERNKKNQIDLVYFFVLATKKFREKSCKIRIFIYGDKMKKYSCDCNKTFFLKLL